MSEPTKEANPSLDDAPLTIDEAITTCEKVVFWHRFYSFLTLVLLVICTFAFYDAFKNLEKIANAVFLMSSEIDKGKMEDFISKHNTYVFMICGLYLVVFGILVAIYRFHLVEISRNEQIKLGFWRIRIAARNTKPGFQTEVRQSLTKDAFSFNNKGSFPKPLLIKTNHTHPTGFSKKVLEQFV